jgi:hypothetical protein
MSPKPLTIMAAAALSVALLIGAPAFAKRSAEGRCVATGASSHPIAKRDARDRACARVSATAGHKRQRARGEGMNPGNHRVHQAGEVKATDRERRRGPDRPGYAQGAGS